MNIILGTAGHVDHGKTTLVKALTGVDTDRLKEEKERGITIELGFAPLRLPGGANVAIVDVPGHERFVKNMVAGAAGIDLVALVIAADEGVMPQTREHLAICSLLGIRKGLVALTKVDMVDDEWRSLVMEDVREFLNDTFLRGAPIVPLSAVTGEGLPEFLAALTKVAAEVERRADLGIFRLPVDRVFTMKGFGTVVTGTLISGRTKVGADVEIMPAGIKAKIRGIQVHNEAVEGAEAGQRTALNIQGLDRTAIARGDILTDPGFLRPSRRLDIHLHYLEANPKALKDRSPVRFHAGTSEIIARLHLLGADSVPPGGETFAQLLLEKPTALVGGDHYVLRSYSPVTTIGGGVVLDPEASKHRRQEKTLERDLRTLLEGPAADKAAVILNRCGLHGATERQIVVRTGIARPRLRTILEDMFSKKEAFLVDPDERLAVAAAPYTNLRDTLLGAIHLYHEKNPLKEGMPREELRSTAGVYIHPRLFAMVLRDLEKADLVIVDREYVRLPQHRVKLAGDLEELSRIIPAVIKEAALAPPTVREIMERFPGREKAVQDVLAVLIKDGILVKVTEDLYYDRGVLEDLKEDYRSLLLRDGKATPASFKELTGLSRKFIIALMEYFDRVKLTIRTGEHRILRGR
ncbi:MAG TPA: selenocysteine-specific translation elongation factor [Syntrophales bacterium]|nr:selenocysteine-specific translation elongation factor [Syntrophales bacterium]HOM07973.1 selenocysteine-specific translation elongation factor [Syntrophales bacterium]HPQ06651.1 selenocysteine-specific translation elongation factor [Syntrophales bacterium]